MYAIRSYYASIAILPTIFLLLSTTAIDTRSYFFIILIVWLNAITGIIRKIKSFNFICCCYWCVITSYSIHYTKLYDCLHYPGYPPFKSVSCQNYAFILMVCYFFYMLQIDILLPVYKCNSKMFLKREYRKYCTDAKNEWNDNNIMFFKVGSYNIQDQNLGYYCK